MPTPMQTLADPNSTPAQRLVSTAYIRRLLIEPHQSDEGLALAAAAGLEPEDAFTAVRGFLIAISPYGRWQREGGTYPRPEETFTGWAAQAVELRTIVEGLSDREAHTALQSRFGSELVRFAVIVARSA